MKHKIGVITNSTSGQSLDDLLKSAQKFDVGFELVPAPLINISDFEQSHFVKKLLNYDVIYYRTGLRDTALEALTGYLSHIRKPLINGGTIPNLHRKIQQALLAGQHNILQPKTLYVKEPIFATLAEELNTPFVAKPDFSSHGNDVTLIQNESELKNLLETTNRDRWLFQEYITNATEYRVYTLGNKYVTSYKKTPGSTDFRANLHAGGTMTATESSYVPLLKTFSEKIAEVFQSDIAGIDVFIKNNVCYFIELNWQPGWEFLDDITGTDFSDETIKYILSKIKSKSLFPNFLNRYR